jgi:hypothetical protein
MLNSEDPIKRPPEPEVIDAGLAGMRVRDRSSPTRTFTNVLVRVRSLQGHLKEREFVFAAEMKANPSELAPV